MDKIYEAYIKAKLNEKKPAQRDIERGWVVTDFHHEKGHYEKTSKTDQDQNIKIILKDVESDIKLNISNLKGWKIDKYSIKNKIYNIPNSGHKGKRLLIKLKKIN